MDHSRRRLLKFLSTAPLLTTNLSRCLSTVSLSALPTQIQSSPRAEISPTGIVLNNLVATKLVHLGQFRSHRFYVLLDDIASPTYMAALNQGYNIQVVSSYSYVNNETRMRDQYSGALLRAVLERIRKGSPRTTKSFGGPWLWRVIWNLVP